MAEKTYLGLPRREIRWFPEIKYNSCVANCTVCFEKCGHGVFSKRGNKVIVAQPYECIVGCESCNHHCPVGAISFPSRDELRQQLRTLRQRYGYGNQS